MPGHESRIGDIRSNLQQQPLPEYSLRVQCETCPTHGELRIGDTSYRVAGDSWLDRELMFYQLRDKQGRALPGYVEREFEGYLKCGRLEPRMSPQIKQPPNVMRP